MAVKSWKIRMLSLFLLLCMSGLLLAEITSNTQPEPANSAEVQTGKNSVAADKQPYSFLQSGKSRQETPESSADALTVSLGLVFILMLIFSLAWFMRKMGYSNISGHGQLKLLATMNLGQKEKIALIQVGEQQLLVGITASQINTLYVLEEPLEALDAKASGVADNRFAKKLSDTLAGMKVKN